MIKPPFPYFGKKSKVARTVWERFGDVGNYIEPFCGSMSVLLARPLFSGSEIANDADGYVVNFFRAVQKESFEVEKHAEWPLAELDLHARNHWLINHRGELLEKLLSDPNYYDAQIAGWWLWGIRVWLGRGWATKRGLCIPMLDRRCNDLEYDGTSKLSLQQLRERIRNVKITCGDWKRVVKESVLRSEKGITGVFLDPPYSHDSMDNIDMYFETYDVAPSVKRWAVENGNDPNMRIALCGYEGDYNMPSDWQSFEWSTSGGFANVNRSTDTRAKDNAKKERIWFSPHCLPAKQMSLFEMQQKEQEESNQAIDNK